MRSTKARRRLLAQAQELAEDRAVRWCVYRTDSKGNLLTGWKLVKASSRAMAMRQARRAVGASPSLPSSEWRAIYQEVGL